MTSPTTWIGLPAYNEELAIAGLLDDFLAVYPDKSLPYRIVLYNDGCTDGTVAAARAWEDHLNIDIIGRNENLGLGAGLLALISHAVERGRPDDLFFVMDCDDTHSPRQLAAMTAVLVAGRDVVIASRYRRDAQVQGVAAHRRLLSLGAAALFKLLHPCRDVLDYTCGYRGYRVALLHRALAHYGGNLVTERGFACMVELLLKLNRLGARFGEVPLVLRYDRKQGASKMDVGGNTLRLLTKSLGWRLRGLQ